ncbi:glycosyltransferase family 4 protein [Halorubrum sp. Ea8]|uniref:glycosyltransferase family 4 protein n=1 Tax=Halorubrum sp. Ea8 TaxID=1383841 RepID=UPI000B9930CE|nr:glycosyltransferase family 4 protein [Halorubrum sp. Ea8]OYR44591.1 glycosyltransferase [Halorubrum sp. Ea8]
MYSVLGSAINHPDAINPYHGIFNHRALKSLSDAGIDLDVVSPRPYAPPFGPYSAYSNIPATENWGAYTVHHPRFWYLLPKRLFYGLSGESYANRVPKYVEATFTPPDVVHACHIYPDGYGMLPYARKHDLPLFVVAHGTLLNTFESQRSSVRSKIRETLSAATGVLCVSDELSEIANRLTDPLKVATVPIGADPQRFPVDREQRLRRELDISGDATVVLFVGQFSEAKGVGEITDMLPEVDLENTVFVFVGTGGEMETELRRTVGESSFSDRHVYAGLPPLALRRWYAVADLLLLPSHSEGRPTVIYEAMASETAVLASTVGGVPEQVVDGETGLLVPPRDPAALKNALESLAGDRDRLRKMGKKGSERLHEKKWTWADHADRVTQLHLEAIENGASPTTTSH